MQLEQVAELPAGYGAELAFAADGQAWASGSAYGVHVFRDLELELAETTPAEPLAALRFHAAEPTLLPAPLAYDLAEQRWLPLPPLDEALREGLDVDPEELTAVASAWAPEGDDLVVLAEHRPPRGIGRSSSYSGPMRRLLLLDGRARELRVILSEGSEAVGFAALAVDERHVAAGALEVAVWERGSGAEVARHQSHSLVVRRIAWNPDGNLLASVDAGGGAVVWDISQGQAAGSWKAHADEARAVAFHPTLPALVTGGRDGRVVLWSTEGELLAEEACPDWVDGAAFAPAGDRLVVARAGSQQALRVYDVQA